MRRLGLLVLGTVWFNAFGLIEVDTGGLTVDTSKYIDNVRAPTSRDMLQAFNGQKDKLAGQHIRLDSLLSTSKSGFSLGKVLPHKIDSSLKDYSFFMIGKDSKSLAWLSANADYLKKIKAYGLMADKASKREIDTISDKYGLSFITMSLDGLDAQFGTNNYPFVLHNGWVKQ